MEPNHTCPIISSDSSIHPSPPKGDFSNLPNRILSLRVKLVIFLTSPPLGAQLSYSSQNKEP